MMNILIIDDNVHSRNLLRKVLENLGHSVKEAGDGKSGLVLILKSGFDLVFLDWQMPEMDGLEVLESLKQKCDRTLIVMMTAFSNLKVSVRAFTLGIVNFIVKPQTHQDILDSLEIASEILDEKKQVDAAKQTLINAQAAKEANRLKYLFLSTVNHELKTPLSVIIGFSERIPHKIASKQYSKIIEFSKHLNLAANQLTHSINNILDYLQIDVGELTLNKEATYIKSILEQIRPELQAMADEKKISLKFNLSDNVPSIIIDPARLIQIINLLYSNAVKFTPDGGEIMIDLLHEQNVILRISDTGIGFKKDEPQDIFAPFEQIERNKTEQQGLGIGLTLTKALVELQGGKIIAHSIPKKGSSFTLSFPIANSSTSIP